MKNQIIGSATFGPVYARKIDVFYFDESGVYKYVYSTNASRTCREAAAKARADFPATKVLARFAIK